ncbi:helix-turn-helix domain-containing protein [Sinomonas soli]
MSKTNDAGIKLVGLAEAAARYQITTKTLRRMISAGEIPAYMVSSHIIRLDLEQLDAIFLAAAPYEANKAG